MLQSAVRKAHRIFEMRASYVIYLLGTLLFLDSELDISSPSLPYYARKCFFMTSSAII